MIDHFLKTMIVCRYDYVALKVARKGFLNALNLLKRGKEHVGNL